MRHSRIGRRVVGLFIVSALLPLCLCAAFLLRDFAAELNRTQRQNLDAVVRSFGMTVLGRLGSVDDVVMALMQQPGVTDTEILDAVSKMPWARSVHRVALGQPRGVSNLNLPGPDARQVEALRSGEPVMLWGGDKPGAVQVYLVRTLPTGAWLYTEVNSSWLWSDASEYAGPVTLVILDNQGRSLFATAAVESELLELPQVPTADGRREGTQSTREVIAHDLIARSWELFLAGRFSSPSWRLVAVAGHSSLPATGSREFAYLVGLVVLTILMITWLSMTTIRRQLRPLGLLTQATRRIAQRDFHAFRDMSWNDEFGDLARSFDTMAGNLKTQFAALETLAEVDRLLLSAPQLELILGTLLPRVADLLACDTVSVLLFDTDSTENARVYDFHRLQGPHLPVRRIACEISSLRAMVGEVSISPVNDRTSGAPGLLVLPDSPQITRLCLQPLKCDGELVGALCMGYMSESQAPQESGITVADLADRLSLILANLKQAERIRRQANFDSLTGLQNRHLFSECLRNALADSASVRGTGSLLYIDLDHFKQVNDTAGHAAGDELLRIVAARLTDCSEGGRNSIARLGGDEFAVLLPADGPDVARRLAEQIIAAVELPIVVGAREYHVSASIGIAAFPVDGTTLEDLLKAGDIAMYHAKGTGRGRAVFYQAPMQQKLMERLKLENDMQRAFHGGEFTLHYQPIVSEGSAGGLAVEALLRWPRLEHAAWTPPAVFVPVAEENGLIIKLGDWVLRSACRQFASWRDAGLRLDHISVNVSVRQLRESGFITAMLEALRDNGMRGSELQLEITESVLAAGPQVALSLSEIASHGVTLALDDFGTGYSSLSYLRSFPIHTLKIDQSFIVGLPHDPAACRLAESIILMCTAMGKRVVAEGVETEAQREFLMQAGRVTLQGFLIGRPMEAVDIPGFARRLRSGDGMATLEANGSAMAV